MHFYQFLPVLLFLAASIIIIVKKEKLTLLAAVAGAVIAVFIFAGAGYAGLSMLAAFFVLGTIATSWKKNEKRALKPKEDQSLRRNTGQVLANGGVAGLAGILIYFIPSKADLLRIIMAASLASAMADTLSSELGMVYGRRFYNIITFEKDGRGLDGVISVEGTLIGLTGSTLIAIIYALGLGWSTAVLVIIAAGTIGNLSDSVLGALMERRHYLNNNAVNLLNTLIAALAAGLYSVLA